MRCAIGARLVAISSLCFGFVVKPDLAFSQQRSPGAYDLSLAHEAALRPEAMAHALGREPVGRWRPGQSHTRNLLGGALWLRSDSPPGFSTEQSGHVVAEGRVRMALSGGLEWSVLPSLRVVSLPGGSAGLSAASGYAVSQELALKVSPGLRLTGLADWGDRVGVGLPLVEGPKKHDTALRLGMGVSYDARTANAGELTLALRLAATSVTQSPDVPPYCSVSFEAGKKGASPFFLSTKCPGTGTGLPDLSFGFRGEF